MNASLGLPQARSVFIMSYFHACNNEVGMLGWMACAFILKSISNTTVQCADLILSSFFNAVAKVRSDCALDNIIRGMFVLELVSRICIFPFIILSLPDITDTQSGTGGRFWLLAMNTDNFTTRLLFILCNFSLLKNSFTLYENRHLLVHLTLDRLYIVDGYFII